MGKYLERRPRITNLLTSQQTLIDTLATDTFVTHVSSVSVKDEPDDDEKDDSDESFDIWQPPNLKPWFTALLPEGLEYNDNCE